MVKAFQSMKQNWSQIAEFYTVKIKFCIMTKIIKLKEE